MKPIKKCEGNCIETHGEHNGSVKEVVVSDPANYRSYDFNYCQNAIEEDIRRGFIVKEKTT